MGERHGLKKYELKTHTVVFMIFALVAAGCYGIEEMIPESGPGLTILLLIVLPFVWGLPFGLVASELGSLRPTEGGYYRWVQEAMGEFWGFQAGWWRTVSIYIDNTLYVILAGSYLESRWDLNFYQSFAFKAAVIIFFTYINIKGIEEVGKISTILSVLVIVAFGAVAVVGILNWNTNPVQPFTPEPIEGIGDLILYIGAGIAVGMWMYSGYESMSTLAGEVKNPQVIPRATMITIPLIMIVYILPTIGGLASVGRWEEWSANGVGYATVMTEYIGGGMDVVFIIVAVLAQFSIYNTYIASGSRGFFSLADDYLAPPILTKCDAKHGVPYVSVLSIGIFNLILCLLPFNVIIVVDVFMLIASYMLVYITAMIMRKKVPESEYDFRIPGGFKFLVVLCAIPLFIAFFSFFINGSDYFLGGMIGIMSGPLMYFIWRRKYGGLAKRYPDRYKTNPKTGLGQGDLAKMETIFLLLLTVGIIAIFFLPWFEQGWVSADYFNGMLPNKENIQDLLMVGVKIFTAVNGGLALFIHFYRKRVDNI